MNLRLFQKTQRKLFTIPIQAKQSALEKLNQLQTKNGNTFGKLKLTNLTTQDTIFLPTLQTSAASKRTIDSIAVKGYQKFPASFIKYYAGIKKGAVFDSQQVVEKKQRPK